jgi:hypothetical protein
MFPPDFIKVMTEIFSAKPAEPAPSVPKEPRGNALTVVILAGPKGRVARYNGRLYRVVATEIEETR